MKLEAIIENTIKETVEFEKSGKIEVLGFVPECFYEFIEKNKKDKQLLKKLFKNLKDENHLSIHKRWDLYESAYDVIVNEEDCSDMISAELKNAINNQRN